MTTKRRLTEAQRRELMVARDCADSGIPYYNLNPHKQAFVRKLAALGYLRGREGTWRSYDITDAGRAALAEAGGTTSEAE
jgi:hypothetical protein